MTDQGHSADDALSLLDWKRRIFDIYRMVRTTGDPRAAWEHWKEQKDALFATHPQTPLPPDRRASFTSLPYFDYDPALRFLVEPEPAEPARYDIESSRDGTYSFTRFARAPMTIGGKTVALELYWLNAYGGGVFVSFRDATSGRSTYGAARYLLDTVKGADLGSVDGAIVLDFNFSYNPSCSYDPRWDCPLAPQPNWLAVPVEAGERYP